MKEKIQELIKKINLNKQTSFILILCVVLNLLGGIVAFLWDVPAMLDFSGTFIAAIAGGPIVAAMVTLIPSTVMAIVSATSLWFTLASVLTAVIISLILRNKNVAASGQIFMPLGILTAVIYSVFTIPAKLWSNTYALSGWQSTTNQWMQHNLGLNELMSSTLSELLYGILDKGICVLVAYIVIFIMVKKGRKIKSKRYVVALIFSIILVTFSGAVYGANSYILSQDELPTNYNQERIPVETEIVDYVSEGSHSDAKNYKPISYDKSSGYIATEANCIEETADGYIWIGGPKGLLRYDGNSFKQYTETGITNITKLFVDDNDRLWIGTQDRGLALFSSDMVVYMDANIDFTNQPVIGIAQGQDGTIYAQTTTALYKVTSGGNIMLQSDSVVNLKDMDVLNGYYVGVIDGKVVAYNDGGEVATVSPRKDNVAFTCLDVKGDEILAGCDNGEIIRISFVDDTLTREEKYTNGAKDAIQIIECQKSGDVTFITDVSFGILSSSGNYTTRQIDDFTMLSDIHEDYQGNLWVSSYQDGVCELAENKFVDLFSVAGLEDRVVNAILLEQGRYYIGTDTGLVIIDKDSNSQVSNAITKKLNGVKVTDMYRDTFNNLWFATYGSGLVEFETDNDFHTFSNSNGMGTSSINCVLETYDKSLVAGTANGTIVYFSNNKVMGTDYVVGSILGESGGLKASSILCIERDQYGKLYVGTEDNGLYIIKNKKIQQHITTEDGLQSNMVSKIVAHGSGYYLVTGSGLCFMNDDGVKPINSFEYYNNYDLMLYKDYAYITCSAGLYKVPVSELDADNVQNAVLFGPEEGMTEDLNPYSWSIVDGSKLMLCSTTGVVSFSVIQKDDDTGPSYYKLGLVEVKAGGEEVVQSEDGIYRIEAGTGPLVFTPSVINYNSNQVKFKFFVERQFAQETVFTVEQDLTIDKLKYGRHRLWLQVLSEDESYILQEMAYILEVDAFDYEKDWYVYCLITEVIWIGLYLVFAIVIVIINVKSKRMSNMMKNDNDEL